MGATQKGFKCPSGKGEITTRRSLVMCSLQVDFRKISSSSYRNRKGESVSAECFWFIYSREQYKKCVQRSFGGTLQLFGSCGRFCCWFFMFVCLFVCFSWFTVSITSSLVKLGLSVLALNLGLCWDCKKTH